jgi:hypothetical protein
LNYLTEELTFMGKEAKDHLTAYPASIVEIRVEKENMDLAKEIIADVVGDQLFKRVNFFEKRIKEDN